jgi:hypothetical protein
VAGHGVSSSVVGGLQAVSRLLVAAIVIRKKIYVNKKCIALCGVSVWTVGATLAYAAQKQQKIAY